MKGREEQRQADRQDGVSELSSTGSLPKCKCMQQLGLAEARSQELVSGLSQRKKGPK